MSNSDGPLRLLALDGGGIRGISELIILREMIHRIELDSSSGNIASPRPRDYFDMIGGTGTGGWIAIMLGRLGMTIHEAIITYTDISKKVFSEKKRNLSKEGMYKATLLEDALKEMVKSKLGSDTYHMMEADTGRLPCKTFVSAQLANNFAGNAPELFRTYKSPRGRSINCYIWEAARATSANPQFFKRAHVSDGEITYEFVGGGTGANNPIRVLLTEAAAVFPGRTVGCIISLGAGHPATIAMPEISATSSVASKISGVLLSGTLRALQIATITVRAIADDCEAEAERMAQRFKERPGIYFRFSVVQGMQGIGQGDVEQSNAIAAHTSQYLKMENVTRELDDAVRATARPQGAVGIGELMADATNLSGTTLVPGQRGGQRDPKPHGGQPQRPELIVTPATGSSPSPAPPKESTGNTSLSEYMQPNKRESRPDVPGTSLSDWDRQNGGLTNQGSATPSSAPVGTLIDLGSHPSPSPSPLSPAPGSKVEPYVVHDDYLMQRDLTESIDERTVSNAPSATPARTPSAAESDLLLDEPFTQFLSPNVASLRDSEKYRVQQQLMELSINIEGAIQACTKCIRLYPIYPMLIAVAFSHASLCLGDHSVVSELKDNLDKFAKGSTTPLLWLINHAEIKARLVDVINIEPRGPNHEHSCLLTKLLDWRTINKSDIVCLGVHVAVVLKDHAQAQEFLKQRDQNAQTLLDLLQALLSYSKIDPNMQRTFLHALIKLATKSGRFPQCLKLRSLAWESQPFSGGGFGDVYKGSVKSRPDVPLAIKVVKVYQSSRKDRLLKSFSSEAVVWSHLRHPNVLPFYGVFQQGDATLCLVSPYMGRGNVRSYLREGSKRVNRMLLALDAARGLEYLHNHNPTIVHADIKGVNILVSNSGRACLADFGFATAKDTNQAQAQSTMPSALTVAWSAPEILISFGKPGHQAHTTKSDMYSFGCVCYEIFCERDPFHGAGLPIVLGLIISGKRPERPERGAALHLNDELWRFMSRCWVENANERPSASDAVRLLERLAAKTGVGGAGEPQSTDEWDYSILEEILAETVHPFSMLLGVSMPPS